jgi:hypothetical protein
LDRQSGVHPYRPTQRAGANSSRRALVTCVSSTAPPCGARVIGGCGSPGTVPGVRWPNLAAPIRFTALVNHTEPRPSFAITACTGFQLDERCVRCGHGFMMRRSRQKESPAAPKRKPRSTKATGQGVHGLARAPCHVRGLAAMPSPPIALSDSQLDMIVNSARLAGFEQSKGSIEVSVSGPGRGKKAPETVVFPFGDEGGDAVARAGEGGPPQLGHPSRSAPPCSRL